MPAVSDKVSLCYHCIHMIPDTILYSIIKCFSPRKTE